jgi:glutathione synthase/RimK-type ligase-like ATP-grasp enzyme
MSVQNPIRLALATCAHLPGIHPDGVHLAGALARLGVEPVACTWSDPAVDWSAFDAVLIRTTWDYFQRHEEFLHWLEGLPVPTINERPLMRWNSDKRYLLELAKLGVDIVPAQVATASELPALLSDRRGQDLVVKPTVSGGAWNTVRGIVGEPGFERAIAALPPGYDYLVQAFVPEIARDGEWSLLFFDGEYSHAVLKCASDGEFRVQSQFGGSVNPLEPGAEMLASARKALAAVAQLGYEGHAYARVDGVMVDGRFRLMELEMIEPALFLTDRPDAAERFARQLQSRVRGLAGVASCANDSEPGP